MEAFSLVTQRIIDQLEQGVIPWHKPCEEAVTLEDVYEPYLMRIGFLSRTPRGRCVTRLGYEHLGLSYPEDTRSAPQLNLEEE